MPIFAALQEKLREWVNRRESIDIAQGMVVGVSGGCAERSGEGAIGENGVADIVKKPSNVGVVISRPQSAPPISSVRLPNGTVARVVSRRTFDKAVRNAVGKKSK